MKNFLLTTTSILSLIFASTVFAADAAGSDDASMEAKTNQMAQPIGDAAAGKGKVAVCGACHGRDGNSAIAMNPKLAGQSASYIYNQLMDFKSGARANAIMAGQVAALSEQDMKDIAAYYAEQEVTTGAVKPELLELGQKIYRGGNPESGVPACIACHGPAGKGMDSASFPALGGQHVQYTVAQLKAFRAAGRGDHGNAPKRMSSGDSPAMMQNIAAKMTDDEIEAVSNYVYGLK